MRSAFGIVCLAAAAFAAAARPAAAADNTAPASLPVVAEHTYRMLARVRPLLFWMSKDDVGGARIKWRGDEEGAFGLDLLIGSDPQRAPRGINRWGYIAEQVRGSEAHVIGVMKQSNEQSVKEAESQLASEGRGGYTYRAIQSTAANGEAHAGVTSVRVDRDLTFRDIESLLGMVRNTSATEERRSMQLPAGTRPGLLVALHDLVSGAGGKSVSYAYYGVLYDLRVVSSQQLKTATIDGKRYANLERSEFEIRNRATSETTRFQLTYGTAGELAGIPIHAVYQPRWWFEVQLFLDDQTRF